MKSILLTLCCALLFSVSYGQVPASFANKAVPFVNVPAKPAATGASRGVTQFEVSYHDMDQIYSDNNGFDFGYFGWDMNNSYAISLSPPDSTDDNTIRWAAVVFDSIYDYVNEVPYKKSTFNSMTVDTVYWLYNHQNTSGLEDTLIVSIYAVANTPSGIGFTNSTNMVFSNTLLWADTITTTTSLTQTGGTDLYFGGLATGGVTVPQGQGFVVRLDYRGPKSDVFSLADGNRLECGGSAGAASESVVAGNSFRYYVGGIFTAPTNDFSGIGGLVFPSLPANCQEFYFQNIAISAVVTVDAPLAASASASVATGCPGQLVNLTSVASGGSNDFTYTWSGNGNFTSPNSPQTSVTLPSGNGVETFTLTVVDNVENTTVTSTVNVTVRGINVSLGNDTTINCSDSILVSAATTGFLNGSTFAWSTGANTQSTYVKGGTHTVTVTNNAGCTATDNKVVSLNVNQAVSFTATTFYNQNEADTLAVSASGACLNETIFFNNTSTDVSNAWSFEWNYGDQTGSVNVDGLKAYTATGSYTITLTATDAGGCVITSSPRQINILPAGHPLCVGTDNVAEVELLSKIALFPNPNSGSFIVDLTKVNAENANIMVVDVLGKVVYNTNTFSTTAAPVQNIELNGAANGIYFVRVTANGVTVTSKISVAK